MRKSLGVEMVGQKIAEIRDATDDELQEQGWSSDHIDGSPTVIVLENGVKLFPSRDPEGNGPGCLFGVTEDGVGFYA